MVTNWRRHSFVFSSSRPFQRDDDRLDSDLFDSDCFSRFPAGLLYGDEFLLFVSNDDEETNEKKLPMRKVRTVSSRFVPLNFDFVSV